MKIKYLGTAAAEGWPGIFCNCEVCKMARKLGGKNIRTRSQALIDEKLLIDFPSDTYFHDILYQINLPEIEHIVFTHSHQDHFYPQEFFYMKEIFCKTDQCITIYGNDAIIDKTINLLDFQENPDLLDHFKFQRLTPFTPFEIGEYKLTPLLAKHCIEETCYIYMIEKDKKRLLYGNDTGIFPEATWSFINGKYFDLISLDCTMGQYKEGSNHMGVPDNIEVVKRLQSLGCMDDSSKVVITHFSHNGGLLHQEMEDMVAPYQFRVAYDGLVVVC